MYCMQTMFLQMNNLTVATAAYVYKYFYWLCKYL